MRTAFARWWRRSLIVFASAAALGITYNTTGSTTGVTSVDFDGRQPSIVMARGGETHIAYVADTAEGPRVFYRNGSGRTVAVSPAGQRVDARGEATPAVTIAPHDVIVIVYSVAGEQPAAMESHEGHHHGGSSELRVQTSSDGGRTWSEPRKVNDDGGTRSHGFADATCTRNGNIVVSWLDNRAGQQGLQTTVIGARGSIEPSHTTDAKTCQCCRTSIFTSSNGTVWVAYRDLGDDNKRNISYATSHDGGRTFIAHGPVADDHWSVNGCPESGPRFTETADHAVWTAWFNGGAKVIEAACARSDKFSAVETAVRSDATTPMVNHPDIGTLPDGRLVVFYEAVNASADRAIAASVRESSGKWSAPIVIAPDGALPRYAHAGDHALLAYTHRVDGKPHVVVLDPLPLLHHSPTSTAISGGAR